MSRFLLTTLIAFLSACGVASTPAEHASNAGEAHPENVPNVTENHIEGSVAGIEITPEQVMFATGNFAKGPPGLLLMIGETPGVCEDMQQNRMPRNHTLLGLGFLKMDGSAIDEGTYKTMDTGDSPRVVVPRLYKFDDKCSTDAPWGKAYSMAHTATATLSHFVEGEAAAGTFEVTFVDGQPPITGAFHATYCEAPWYLEAGEPQNWLCRD